MILIENFIDKNTEDAIISLVPIKVKKRKMRNQILRFGSLIPYDNYIVSKEIPEIFKQFENNIPFDSVTINEYYEGQSIGPHIDKGAADIYIISLLSDAEMEFTKDNMVKKFLLPRYSLARMTGELRREWKHSVEAKEKRYSVVFILSI